MEIADYVSRIQSSISHNLRHGNAQMARSGEQLLSALTQWSETRSARKSQARTAQHEAEQLLADILRRA